MEIRAKKCTDEQINFLKEHAKNLTLKELTNEFNNKFHTNRSKHSIESSCRYRRIKYVLMPTGFQKNNTLPCKPIGSTSLDNGYIYVKIAQPDVWELKHRLIYEKFHKIKKDEVVIFLDGNKRNFDIDNLKAVTRSEQVAYQKFQCNKEKNSEIQEIYLKMSKINSKVKNLLKDQIKK